VTNEEIKEAARLLGSLPGLRDSLAEVDFDDRQISARRMTVAVDIGHYTKSSPYDQSFLRLKNHEDSEEIISAVLRIVRRRRRERLNAALRRLEQLGVTP